MNVKIQSVKFDADKRLVDFIQAKMDKMDRFVERAIGAQVTLRIDKDDEQGNKVRRFTGMTGPLTVTVAAVENAKDDAGKDTFTYGGKTYAVLVTGKKKSDTIRETKYVHDTKNRLVSYTDPEGRTETYTYDCNSNLTKTVDKNGNTLKNTYDNKNRLTDRKSVV